MPKNQLLVECFLFYRSFLSFSSITSLSFPVVNKINAYFVWACENSMDLSSVVFFLSYRSFSYFIKRFVPYSSVFLKLFEKASICNSSKDQFLVKFFICDQSSSYFTQIYLLCFFFLTSQLVVLIWLLLNHSSFLCACFLS